MNHALTKGSIRGLYVPLVTPMLYAKFDSESMERLIASVDSFVDGYVPCLSSGEGQLLTDVQWVEAVGSVRALTPKPVIAGIKREKMEDTLHLAEQAALLACDAVLLPVPHQEWGQIKTYFEEIVPKIKLPILIYNTETTHISDISQLQELDQYRNIIAIKDSSMNRDFFAKMCAARLSGDLQMTVLEGMEHQLDVPQGCDGYLTSLLNIEAQLLQNMFERPAAELNRQVLDLFCKYNLGADWFITLKALLFSRGIIRSSEQVKQIIELAPEVLEQLRKN